MDKDGVTGALFSQGAEIIPVQDLKGKEHATKRFEINDLYEVVCTRALSRMKHHEVLEDGAPSNDRLDGPRCKCGARMGQGDSSFAPFPHFSPIFPLSRRLGLPSHVVHGHGARISSGENAARRVG